LMKKVFANVMIFIDEISEREIYIVRKNLRN
jgi:hypothetical protein